MYRTARTRTTCTVSARADNLIQSHGARKLVGFSLTLRSSTEASISPWSLVIVARNE